MTAKSLYRSIPMSVKETIRIARRHVVFGSSASHSSARLCLADAVALYDDGEFEAARQRALEAIAYMVGIGHPDYIRGAAKTRAE